MQAVIKMTVVVASLIGGLAMPLARSEAQAPNEMVRQYGYQFCNVMAGGINGAVRDCMYSTWAQCQAAASGQGYCVENAAYAAARANASVPLRSQRVRH